MFALIVAGPVLREACAGAQFDAWREQSARIAWIALATAVLSGAGWLVVLAADIGGRPLPDVFSDDLIWSVATRTRFGMAWSARLVVAATLACGLIALSRRPGTTPRWLGAIMAALALLLVATLAWSGHASGTPGIAGDIHVAVDALHLVAAGAWIGALVPLALLFAAARRATHPVAVSIVRDVTLRFSTLGVIAVGTILATGVFNAWVLVGSVDALIATDYGRLLMVKIGLFAVMVWIATFNRLRLTPRLSSARTAVDARRRLQRNCVIEAALGLLILVIVGALGTLPPGLHAMPSTHVHGS